MAIDVLRPSELSDAQLQAWRGFQAADPDLGNPFLSPEWAQAVERARAPGRTLVAMQHAHGRSEAFLAVRAGPFTAQPVGSPLSDYQGVVAAPGVTADLQGMLRGLGVTRYDFTHSPASQSALAAGFQGRQRSCYVDVSVSPETFAKRFRADGSDLLRDIGKRIRKAEREVGPVTFTWRDQDRNALGELFNQKRNQYRATRQTDVLKPAWVGRLMEDLVGRTPSGDPHAFGAMFSTLRIDGRFAAGHLGLHAGPVVHAWFIAHDPAFGRYSPGMVLITELARKLTGEGWKELDLGGGEYPFKARLCDASREIAYGFVGVPSPAAAFRGAAYGIRRAVEEAPLGRVSAWPGKAMRRWDVIRAL